MAEPAISTHELRRTFSVRTGGMLQRRRSPRRVVAAVDGLSLEIATGERVAYIGPNGAGKSTSIRILTGILHPTSGTATVLGLEPWTRRLELTHRIGTIFGQRSQLVPDLPAHATFDLLARVYGIPAAEHARRRDELAELLGARDLLDQPVRQLSLGQRMRCELVASLLHDPSILFLDEPTIGLDLVAKRVLRELVVRLNEQRGTTVLLTSHDVADIETVCERVLIIDHGRLVYDGTVDELRRTYLTTRMVHVRFGDRADPPTHVEGCEILDSAPDELELRVNTAERRIGAVLDELVAHRVVDDIAITEPPLESVIEHIYTGAAIAP